jgi:hypothetical protein
VPFLLKQLVGDLSAEALPHSTVTITDAITALACNLRLLYLQNNVLIGYLPSSMAMLTQLQAWNMGYNKLVGTWV